MLKFPRLYLPALVIVVAAGGFLLYGNILDAPFVFDDHHAIVNNLKLHNPLNYLPLSGPRDVGFFSFALNFSWSRLDVFSYHLVNILIHIVNALLVYLLYRLLIEKFSPYETEGRRVFIAAIIALLFLVHPVQTNAVTYIVQRFTSLATLFYLLSLIAYIKASDLYSGRRRFFSLSHLAPYLCSLVTVILAMKTKEITFTLPVAIIMYEIFVRLNSGNRDRRPVLYLLPFFLTLLIIPAGMINTDVPIGEMLGEISDKSMEDPTVGRTDYLLTQFRVIATYLRLLFIPVNQNLDYDYPAFHSLADPQVVLSLLLHIIVIGSALFLLFRFRGKETIMLLIPFGIFWFYLTLSVESSIIPIRDVIFEHRLYLPSSGLMAAFVTGFTLLGEKISGERGRRAAGIFFFVAILVLSAATVRRNAVWTDDLTLWEDTVRKSPRKARPVSNLGNAYQKMGMTDEAVKAYLKGIELNPGLQGTYNNLGNAYKAQGRFVDAMNAYIKAIDINPRFAEGYYNLGVVLNDLGERHKALENLRKAVEISPALYDAYMTMGNIYDDMGMKGEALQAYTRSLEINPYSYLTYYNRGVLYDGIGDRENARRDYLRSLELNPSWEAARKRLQSMGG